jgi:hypothetical protein
MTDKERLLFDLNGYLMLEDVLSTEDVAAANEAIDVALRPADAIRINSRGPIDSIESCWQRVFHDRALSEVPFVVKELGRRVRAYFSSGIIAVRREAGIFREWEADFRRLMNGEIVPEGAVDRMDEIALAQRSFAGTLEHGC